MTKRLILVAGNIGSGKTSLTKLIGDRLGWFTAFESVSDNPYLPNFYSDMKQWSFHLQVFFLGHRARQHLDMWEDPRSAIIDRSIYEDAYIFARALHKMGNLSVLDYQSYLRVFELVVRSLPSPSLLVYLKAPIPVLIQRIQSRGREIETGINAEYLGLLDSFYNDWMNSFDLDFVHLPEHLDLVVKHIQDKLAGKEEIVF
jgi:deoxyadenosine/deoxycytidine kinase